jgi:hypothetical protein
MNVTLNALSRRPRRRPVPTVPPSALRVAAISYRRQSHPQLKSTFFGKGRP